MNTEVLVLRIPDRDWEWNGAKVVQILKEN